MQRLSVLQRIWNLHLLESYNTAHVRNIASTLLYVCMIITSNVSGLLKAERVQQLYLYYNLKRTTPPHVKLFQIDIRQYIYFRSRVFRSDFRRKASERHLAFPNFFPPFLSSAVRVPPPPTTITTDPPAKKTSIRLDTECMSQDDV